MCFNKINYMYFPGYIRKNMLYSVLINVFLMYLFKYYSMIKNGYVDSLKSRQESGVEISKMLRTKYSAFLCCQLLLSLH